MDHPKPILLHNGRVLTMDRAGTIAEAISLRGGRVEAVGPSARLLAAAAPDAERIDLGGRTVIPGLIDSHLHVHMAAMNATAVQLMDARSVADVQRAVAERAGATPPGEWITASSGWHEGMLAEGRLPTRWELDEAAPDNPVFIPRGGHVCTVNSRALARAGIDAATPDPAGGLVVRDPGTGEATGVLLETAAYLARRVLPPPPPAPEQLRLLRAMLATLNGLGITGTVEPGLDEAKIRLFETLRDDGALTVRTDLLYRADTLAQTERGLALAGLRADDRLRFAGVKFMLDGGIEGARMYQPYQLVPGEQNDPAYRGLLLLPPGGEEEFVAALMRVAEAGLQAQCHAVGDETIDLVVRAYERVDAVIPLRGLRWVVMHIQQPTPDAIARMLRMGIMATAQDHSVLLGHNMLRWWGRQRADYSTPIRLLLDSGLHVGGGTDAPVLPISPFISMQWMVTRTMLNGVVLGPEQGITASEALRLYTIDNAVLMGVGADRGSLEAGKLADLAVLSQDILSVAPDTIARTSVLMTLVGGAAVHRQGAGWAAAFTGHGLEIEAEPAVHAISQPS